MVNSRSPTPQEPWQTSLELEALSAAEIPDQAPGPQAESISVASVWKMASPESADAALAGESEAFVYRRDGHPNERSLARKLARLHGAEHAAVTAQGMSSIGAIALALLQPKVKVWVANELYGKSRKLFAEDLARWQVQTEEFDPVSEQDIDRLSQVRVGLVFVETMSNPRLRIPDLKRLARAAHQAGGLLVVDNTFATHLLCRPLNLGADLVVESLSKQVNGHSDSMLGLVAGKDPGVLTPIVDTISTFGMASSPLDCFLTHRGVMSLAVRMQRACENAQAVAQALDERSNAAAANEKCRLVKAVDYPGLANHPQHQLAKQRFTGGFGWMVSCQLDLDRHGVRRWFESLAPEISFVPSLGDVTTTVSHPASTSHRGLEPSARQRLGISEGTVRISCGVEPTEWLVQKILHSLNALL